MSDLSLLSCATPRHTLPFPSVPVALSQAVLRTSPQVHHLVVEPSLLSV
ncbi:hypothetical protein [Pseudomonas abietaniphila]|nr:hypothetical protein [Pseudomonas abietaniphila]